MGFVRSGEKVIPRKFDRAKAEEAALLVIEYCASGEFVSGVDEVLIPAEENKLIFAALLEADWKTRLGKDVFAMWRAGAGKDYIIKKLVAKK